MLPKTCLSNIKFLTYYNQNISEYIFIYKNIGTINSNQEYNLTQCYK